VLFVILSTIIVFPCECILYLNVSTYIYPSSLFEIIIDAMFNFLEFLEDDAKTTHFILGNIVN